MAEGILSKGMKLSYASSSTGSYTELTNLQEVPELGGSADSVEITTMDDAAHTYMNGLLDFGDSVDFTFLYEKEQFTTLNGLGGANAAPLYWKVSIPDGASGAAGTTCSFSGNCSVSLASSSVGDALTYTLSIKPNSAMTFA